MKNRTQRQLDIRKIISEQSVHSQEELLLELKKSGHDLTQATLSRDLKILQVAKVPHPDKGYIYVLPEESTPKPAQQLERINYLADGFVKLQFSGNLAVIKTQPGYASSIAAVIDKASPWEIIGTIAGDDTILLIQREGISKGEMSATLVRIMPGLKNRL